MKKVAVILVNYKDYAEKYWQDCIGGLRAQDYLGGIKIFIVDNETSEDSFEFLKKNIPEAQIIRNEKNDGFAKGNNDGIKKALEQGFEYIVLFNFDVAFEHDAVRKMVEVIESDGTIGAVQARLMLWPEKELVNSLGNDTHFLGFGYCRGYREKYNASQAVDKDIFYPSGAAVLFKRKALEISGLLDEEMWMYNEDQDLGWRIWLSGYRCVLASGAVVYHKFEFSRSISKFYWMDRNRIVAMLKNYHWATLLLFFPAFLVMETGLILFSLKTGWFKEKVQVWKYFLSYVNIRAVLKSRKPIQLSRKMKDRDILKMVSGKIWYQEVDDVKLRLVNPVFSFYLNMARKLVFW